MRSSWLALLSLVLLSSVAFADNGKVAFAYPVTGIQIDGNLKDWPETARSYPVDLYSGLDRATPGDFAARFWVGHDIANGHLYVAGEIIDESHVAVNEGWQSEDAWLLYLDREHRASGSGCRLYHTGEKLREVNSPAYDRDPVNSNANWDDVKVAVKRQKDRTIYEWRFELGNYLALNRTIGLDHLLKDIDEGEPEGTTARWGPGWSKSGRTGSLADVMILPSGANLGSVQGRVAWAEPIPDPLPSRVRFTSTKHPSMWVQAEVNEAGRYSTQLPVGEYRISGTNSITDPFSSHGSDNQRRIDLSTAVTVEVEEGQIVDAARLDLKTFGRPDFLHPQVGLLHDDKPIDALEMDAVIETFRRYYDIPGVSVAIVEDGKIAYHNTFGVKNSVSGEPVDKKTLFEAASITKPVFAYTVMRLVERGELSLDEPLHDILPFDNLDGDPRAKAITARHVLSHRTGLDNWPWGGPGTYRNGGTFELNFAPGEGYGYSGEGTNYLARVVEKITGKPIAQVVKEETLATMGMNHTFFAANDTVIEHAAIGHFNANSNFFDIPTEASMASSMHTEASELARFMIGMMEGRGLKQETYDEMWKLQFSLPDDERGDLKAGDTGLALGFFVRDHLGSVSVEHGGNNGDFQSIMILIPEKKAGFAMLANTNVGHKMHYALFRHLIGMK